MGQTRKKLLIVDDTEIDRITLKSILCQEYEVLEAKNGGSACKLIAAQDGQLSAILLDISMPDVDGFGVLEFMAKRHLDQLPVFLVTAEPTVDNVQRAAHYKVAGFIGKPFQQEDLLRRLRAWLNITLEPDLRPEELEETLAYIADLEALYNAWLANCGQTDARYRIVSGLARILLTSYNGSQPERRLNAAGIELVSRAAYFCDIGEMLIPFRWLQLTMGDARSQEALRAHPRLGAKLIGTNRSKQCEYFTSLCSGICLRHHERFDGRGYPDGLKGNDIPVYAQICRLADEFEQLRGGAYDQSGQAVSLVVKGLTEHEGMVSPALRALLADCEGQIIDYFNKLYQG